MSEIDYQGDHVAYHFGEITYKEHSRLGPRVQQNLQLVYVRSGVCEVEVDGAGFVLEAEEAVLLQPGGVETFRFAEQSPTAHGWCEWRAPGGAPDLPEARGFEGPVVGRLSPRMQTLIALAHPLVLSTRPLDQALLEALGRAVILAFLRTRDAGVDERQDRVPEAVLEAVAMIERSLAQPVRLEQIARQVGISPAHLVRQFRAHLNETPMRYLWRIRTEAGARLLRDTALSVSEIAYAVGFQTPYHFSRRFREAMGLPPRAYRRRAWATGRTTGP